jgi:dihydrofolate synthase/folylpolyglutamate synthase
VGDDPPIVLDGAHNPQAADALAGAIREAFPVRKPVIVLGVLADKDAAGIVKALAGVASGFVCTSNSSPRALPSGELGAVVGSLSASPCWVEERLDRAIERASDSSEGAGVVVTGSLYTVGESRSLMRSR